MIDSVIFDMDGVLFDTERLCMDAWFTAGAALNIADIETSVKSCIGLNKTGTRAFLLKKYSEDFPYDDFLSRIRAGVQAVIEKNGLPKKEGVDEILEYLHQNGCRIALATSSGRDSAMSNLNRSGLIRYFQKIITGDMVTNGKPHPEIYQTACAALGAKPESTIAIEDSPNGIRSAHAAGLNVIMVPDLIEPTAEIEKLLFQKFDSLLDVKKYLEKQLNRFQIS